MAEDVPSSTTSWLREPSYNRFALQVIGDLDPLRSNAFGDLDPLRSNAFGDLGSCGSYQPVMNDT